MFIQSSVTLLAATNSPPLNLFLFFPLAIVHAVLQQTERLEQITGQFVLSQNDESVSNHGPKESTEK